jgi:hypothetical protein
MIGSSPIGMWAFESSQYTFNDPGGTQDPHGGIRVQLRSVVRDHDEKPSTNPARP